MTKHRKKIIPSLSQFTKTDPCIEQNIGESIMIQIKYPLSLPTVFYSERTLSHNVLYKEMHHRIFCLNCANSLITGIKVTYIYNRCIHVHITDKIWL